MEVLWKPLLIVFLPIIVVVPIFILLDVSFDDEEVTYTPRTAVSGNRAKSKESIQPSRSDYTSRQQTAKVDKGWISENPINARVSTPKDVQRTPAHNLAIIHEGWKVPKDYRTVYRFQYLLQELDANCIESKEQIADATVQAQQIILKERGMKMNLLSIVEEMNKTVKVYRSARSVEQLSYIEVLALQILVWEADYN